MRKQYKIGYYYERKVKQILEKDGYLVWRSPASKSPIDIIAINDKGYIRLIQVKSFRKYIRLKPWEIYNLKELAKKFENINHINIELWIFYKGELVIYNKKDILIISI